MSAVSGICLHNATLLAGYAQMDRCAVYIEDGRIADVFSERRFQKKTFHPSVKLIDVHGSFVAPGFIDTHIHGFAGYGTEDKSVDSILAMSVELGRYGVTSFCPTIYPMTVADMEASITACVDAMGHERGARIAGVHLEGPFISPQRLGVQNPAHIKPVDLELMERLHAVARGNICNMTVAPELKGMRELALFCISHNIVLQAGHTNATYENMLEGMQAGILHSTHFFNAMSRLHHRDPGAVGAILIHPELSCEIIADGKHVHPDLIRLLMRDKPQDKVVLVTDALKPTEQHACILYANNEEVEFVDGLFQRKSDGVIAGSALTMIRGVRNLVEWGVPLQQAVKFASANPAKIMQLGKRGQLVPGHEADIVVFNQSFDIQAVLRAGCFIRNELGE